MTSASEKKRRREEALSRPATGQFTPGALSAANAQTTNRTVAPSIQSHLTNPQLAQLPQTPPAQIGMSAGFAQKLAEAQAQPNMMPNQVMPGVNPNLPPLFNTAAPAATIPSNPMNSAAGQANQLGMVQQALNSVARMFGQGVYDEYGNPTKGLSAVDLMILGGAAGSGVAGQGAVKISGAKDVIKWLQPGVINKTASLSMGAKAWNTIKSLVLKTFTQEKIVQTITANGQRYKLAGGVSKLTPMNIAYAISAAGGVAMFLTYLGLQGKESQAIGTRDVKEEATGMLGMYARDMYRDGNNELGDLFIDMAVDASNVSISAMPGGKGTIQGANYYQDIINKTAPMIKEHYANMAEMEAEGMTPQQTADFWLKYHEKVEANKAAQAKASVDYYNTQRRITEREILAAREQSNRESAAFWLEYQKQLEEMQKKEREEQAKFWLEYKKLVMRMNEESRGSSLKFGLLR